VTTIPGKAKSNLRSKGKNKIQMAFLPLFSVHCGKSAYPFTPNGVYFISSYQRVLTGMKSDEWLELWHTVCMAK
jgi:hypothetical protein